MSVLGLQIEWAVPGGGGLERVAVAFERAGAEVVDLGKHVFPRLGSLFAATLSEQFDDEGNGPRGHWAPLSPSYEEWKSGKHPGLPILELSGAMRESLTSPTAFKYDSTTFTYGTEGVQYASFHQTGTAKMPARPPFDFGPEFERELTRVAAQGVREAVREGSAGLLEVEGES